MRLVTTVGLRLLQMIGVLVAVALVTFLAQQALPGDQASIIVGVRPGMSSAERERLVQQVRQEFGLDQPVPIQFLLWSSRAVRLDFGTSEGGGSVRDSVAARIGPSLELALAATLVSGPLAVLVALWAGSRGARSSLVRGLNAVAAAIFVLPSFWVGILLVLAFAVVNRWLPASGYVSFAENPADHIRRLILPTLTLVIPQTIVYYRYLEDSLRTALRSRYARAARARGIDEGAVLFRHALPNALLPMLTVMGLTIGSLIGGVVIVESLFSWPGMGQLLLFAVTRKDFNTMVMLVLITAAAFVILSAVVDAVYRLLDPRLRRA